MQIAQSNVAPNSRDRRSMTATSKISYCYSEESISSQKEFRGFGILGTKVTTKILRLLDFTTLFQLRQVCKGITDLISTEADTYPGLRSINMSAHHKKMDDVLLEGMADFCGNAINTLSLKGCWIVTNRAYEIIRTKMPNLLVLNMASVWESTDSGLSNLSKVSMFSSSMITTLDLSNCKKITDAGIHIILDSCKSITHLEVSHCKFLTEKMFDHPRWRHFKRLNLQRCTAVRDNAFTIWNNAAQSTVLLNN
jgi:hypothetical protein